MELPRRLYFRMALYISAALVAFVALGIGAAVFVASTELENYSATRHGTLGQKAADILTEQGREGLSRWLTSDAAIPDDVTVYVLDEQSRDILDRPLPRELEGFIRQSVVGPPDAADGSFRPVRLAPQLIGPDGERYAFLVLPNRIGIFGSPAVALGVGIAGLLVIATVAWFIARTVGRPIGELQLAARELALGHIDRRVPEAIVRRKDELGRLAADFNTMADRLAALLAGRSQLMGELSHELRSPLARLQAALALAGARHEFGDAERIRVEQEIRRMDAVIGDLLRFSRLDAAANIGRKLVRIEELLTTLLADEEVEARTKDLRLGLATNGDLAVVGDPDLLRSGFENVLRNAIRYAPRGSEITVVAARERDGIAVAIRDRGPGVPPEYLERIFEPYVRVPKSIEDAGSTGLGLAIARRVAEVHGGRIAARNRDPGGLEVTFTLPAAG
jgi:two-component system sensor histidine kinase CpxA